MLQPKSEAALTKTKWIKRLMQRTNCRFYVTSEHVPNIRLIGAEPLGGLPGAAVYTESWGAPLAVPTVW